ncbi:MAG: poly(3-hydroxybutyrate) depolymerase [Hyphomicrobiaceae bacterium]|nr:poly(3-hydroxybutyrate) depolymerase [Hyphomicrobiaceae bacterium]MCC0006517.1 poly(3-hydroxybutyrate) depolymerase [Hyphomicrobiaceae bacterium]
MAGCRKTETAVALPPLGAVAGQTSVSGISSGAYMAGQFQLAHGPEVVGAGIIAGGPYGCAESLFADLMPGPGSAFLNITKAINGCMLNAMQVWGVPNPPMLADRARSLAQRQDIAPIEATLGDRVYLFTGRSDHTVVPAIVASAAAFYRELGMPAQQIKFVDTLDAGHAFVTENAGLSCDSTGKPYVVDCDYDQAGDMLTFIYGPLQPPAAKPTGEFIVFDQTAFTRDFTNHGMESSGVVYVPAACRDDGAREPAGCRVHIAFHGCAQNRALVGDSFIRDTGFARWADTNRLVILFPEAATSPFNPQGCWDWWGYTGRNYLTRTAPQIEAVYRMLMRLTVRGQPS